jgi:hypothetical protein
MCKSNDERAVNKINKVLYVKEDERRAMQVNLQWASKSLSIFEQKAI